MRLFMRLILHRHIGGLEIIIKIIIISVRLHRHIGGLETFNAPICW